VVAGPISLSDFTKDASVDILSGGVSAVMREDPSLSPVLLYNDPVTGGPDLIVPGNQVFLVFDYQFTEPSGNDDEFGAFVFNAVTGLSSAPFEFYTGNAGSGTIAFDLTSLSGLTLGLQFQLAALPADSDVTSVVTVANVRTEERAIPAPLPWLLIAPWLIFGLRHPRRR
jgi:hypothetical protein